MTNEEFRNKINEVVEQYVKDEARWCNEYIDYDYDTSAEMLIEIAREIGNKKGTCDPVEEILWNAFYKGLETIKKGGEQ